MLGARDEDASEMCLKVYKEEKMKVKRCIYQSKKENELNCEWKQGGGE